MNSSLSVRQAAEQWGLSEPQVRRYCAGGRIPGARKEGGVWVLPPDAQKPQPLCASPRPAPPAAPSAGPANPATLFPLMNTPFLPGQCLPAVEAMAAGPQRDIARAEYYYFSGQPEAAAREAEPYLASPDVGARLSACLLYAYASLPIGAISQARAALDQLVAFLSAAGEQSARYRAAAAFVASAGAVLLHLPLPGQMPQTGDFLPLLPLGLRAFALYVQAHALYLRGEYTYSAGTVEAALAMGAGSYPIPAIYLHLVAVMDYMGLKQPDRAKEHLLTAWEIARPDDLIEGFGEHHGLLGAMLEAVIKPRWPEDFKRIIEITYRFSWGWRRVHNPLTGHDVADELTTTEFSICMLAARSWTNQEIAKLLNISVNTVKTHLSEAMKSLHVTTRKALKQYMLR